MTAFAAAVEKDFFPNKGENLMDSLFKQYERVIMESIITSFGLDGLIQDQHGGDVDTIHNVRQIGTDDKMGYKNASNKVAYDERGDYNYATYHSGENYKRMKREAKKDFRETGKTVTDAYAGGELYFPGKSTGADPKKSGEVEHVLTTKTTHEDRGRVLSGLKGEDLADSPENLVFTNKSLNASMGATKDEMGNPVDIPDYIALHPELPEETKKNMMREYEKAKKAYEAKLAKAYYTSSKFWSDTAKATGKTAVAMGARQVWGFIFTEVWFAVRDEFDHIVRPFDFAKVLRSIGEGVKKGFENAKTKYKDLISKFKDGAIAGAMSSLTTTLCNIFFTTAKNVVRIIRQTYASMVQATKVLFINPDNLPFGERMRATAKILATGASIVVGVLVNEALEDSPIGKIPVVGEIISTFCGSLVTGIMTCTLLYYFDNNETINKLVTWLNNIPSVSDYIDYYARQAAMFEKYAAELMEIDLEQFKKEIAVYTNVADKITLDMSETELNSALKASIAELGINIPWQGEFDDFMKNKSNKLVFG